MNQKCLTCSSKRSCVSMLRFLFSGCLTCFVVFNIFLGHESASWSWFCAFQGLWNLTPSSAAIQPNKPRMFMTILICLSWFAQIWSYTGYTLWIEFTARFRTTWNDEIDVLCQDRSWKASPIQKAWSESFGKVCCQTKMKWGCIAFTLHKLKPVGWKDSMPLTKQSKGVVHWIEEGTLHLLLIEVLVLKCEFLRKAEKAMEKRMLVARDRLVDMFIHARSNLPWQHQWPLP